MADRDSTMAEPDRLEQLWLGDFGDAYLERNAEAGQSRAEFWAAHLERFPASSVFEVGCNNGTNLQHLVRHMPARNVWGLDVNEASVIAARARLPEINTVWGVARQLPLADNFVDLVFTCAVLIHQPDDSLGVAIDELVRCSRQWIAILEYHEDRRVAVDYRDQRESLVKRPFGDVIAHRHPELVRRRDEALTRAGGFDDGMRYVVFEKV